MILYTCGGRKREEIIELTGEEDVPVLVTDDGTVVAGSEPIAAWAREHPSAA